MSPVAFCNAQVLAPDQTPLPLDQEALNSIPVLASPVSFEAKREPLSQLLNDVSKQSGISLSLAQGSLADKLVTARVAAMPLSELMGSLAHLYGATWDKTAKGYTLRVPPSTPLEQMSLQSGKGYFSSQGKEIYMSEEEIRNLHADIFEQWMAKNPKTFVPMPISELPEDVQLDLRRVIKQQTWMKLADAYRATKLLSPDATLSLTRHEDRAMTQFGLVARASNARHTLLFNWMSPIAYKKIERPEGWPPIEQKPEQPQPKAQEQP